MNLANETSDNTTSRNFTIALMLLIAILAALPRQSNADGINWTIAPYLWMSDVGLDVFVNSNPAIGTDVPFSDLVDKLDSAFMGHIEMSGERFGAYFDSIFINLVDSSVVSVGPGGPIVGDLTIDADLSMTILELTGFYRMGSPDPGSGAFDILLGARDVDIDLNLNIVLPGPGATPIAEGIDISETDILIGGRFIGRFNERWSYRLRADYSTGGTEGTVMMQAALGYTFGKTDLFSIDVGYRYMNFEIKNDSIVSITETDTTLSGPVIGFIFTF
jgi:hypothetical protein